MLISYLKTARDSGSSSAAFVHWKRSFGSFLTRSNRRAVRPTATKPLQAGRPTSPGRHFSESLVKYFLPSTESTCALHMCTPTPAPVSTFYQPCFGIASITHSQLHHRRGRNHHKLSLMLGNDQPCRSASLKLKSLRILIPKALSSWSKDYRTQSSKFSRRHG